MKKLFILAVILALTSCSIMKQPMRTLFVYDRQYFTPGEANKDIYAKIASFGIDSIPLDKWITLEAKTPDTYVLQRTVYCLVDKTTNYRFIYTIFDNNRYVFKILCDTKIKKGTPIPKYLKRTAMSNSEKVIGCR